MFFFKDFVEIRRNYPELARTIDRHNEQRKMVLERSLLQLQEQGILRPEFEKADRLYLMELSGAMRTFFFLRLQPEDIFKSGQKDAYLKFTNQLLLPSDS